MYSAHLEIYSTKHNAEIRPVNSATVRKGSLTKNLSKKFCNPDLR